MKFAFLVYVSRSGSTMLARQFAVNSPDLVVLPEFRFFEQMLLAGNDSIARMNVEKLLDLMTADYMIGNLDIERKEIENIAEKNCGRGIRPLSEDIVHAYARVQGKKPEIAMIQLGSLHWLKRLLPIFPEAKLVHIFRDARGVVNSMIRSERPYFAGEKMGRGDVFYAARQWETFQRNIAKIRDKGDVPIIEVRYEDFCLKTPEWVESLLQDIGATHDPLPVDSTKYRFDVGQREKSIHTLINKEPVIDRLDGWKTELSEWQGIAIESLARRSLLWRGYDLWFSKDRNTWEIFLGLFTAVSVHVWRTIHHYFRKVCIYSHNWRLLKNRIKVAFVKYQSND